MSDSRTAEQRVEFSFCREDDGDVSIELYVDRHNLINISVGEDGSINWAGMVSGTSSHGGGEDRQALAKLLFSLLNPRVSDD